MRYIVLSSLLVLWGSPAWAQTVFPVFPPSGGEASSVQSCFYECKQDHGRDARFDDSTVTKGKIIEDTLLMLVNELLVDPLDPTQPPPNLIAAVIILDGSQRPLLEVRTELSPLDLDEINICRTLEVHGIVPPQAGVLEILTGVPGFPPNDLEPLDPALGIYAWIKDLVTKRADFWVRPRPPRIDLRRKLVFTLGFLNPFNEDAFNPRRYISKVYGKAIGIGKTECRITPAELTGASVNFQAVRDVVGFPKRGVPEYEQNTGEDHPGTPGSCSSSGTPCFIAPDTVFDVPCPSGETCAEPLI